MVFQRARERIARISKGHSLGRLSSRPKIILMDPSVSDTERLCSLNSTDRDPSSQEVPQNQKISPTPIKK
jgi:hypothetical protein